MDVRRRLQLPGVLRRQQTDVDKGEKLISTKLKEATGMDAKVTCPRGVKLAKGTVTECDVKLGDLSGRAAITQTDDQGNVSWELSEGFVISSKAEEYLTGELSKQAGGPVTVDCGERARVSEPGKTFRCKATPASGATPFEVELTITDKQGTFDAKVVR
ncbi:MAG TPA: DUF4333 domain-containing protein [Kofleriaceae bacterium]|nr:DUF4333 domain-containing protein [Kofleriaceae bacterium]